MTDDLDLLKDGLRRGGQPDPEARARSIALAMENYDRFQGTAGAARPTQDRHRKAGILHGVLNMLRSVSSRPVFATAGSVAALCLGLVVVLPLTEQPPVAPPHIGLDPVTKRAAEPAPEQDAALPEIAASEPEMAAPPAASVTASGPALSEGAPAGRMAAPATQEYRDHTGAGAEPPRFADTMDSEAFANASPNPVKVTAEEPVSTFSIDVDTASYAIVRSSLTAGALPPPDAVRVEEMVNYFPYGYPSPDAGQAPFRSTVTVLPTPWNAGTRLVHIGVQGRLPALADRPPLNLVFLIDTSGSMQDPAKLPLLKQSFRLMLTQLRQEDQVAIVTYAGSAGEVLPATAASERQTILSALDRLDAGGATAGAEGLAQAYASAAKMARPGEVSRVLLATDGDFNLGIADPDLLAALIAKERKGGIYLSVLGFGRGNLDDATMQALAQNGNGQAAYIDTLNEARKVLVDQLTGALFPIANDVKIQVEWNPAAVAEYRLIGYETRQLAREDFANDKVDAGEIGAGHSVTAIYEVTPVGSAARLTDPLRYGAAAPTEPTGELGHLKLRYKAPGETTSALIETPILPAEAVPTEDVRFGVAMAGFGQLLRGATYLGEWGWDEAIALAQGARGEDPFGYRAEAVTLMRLAQSLDG